jgi:CHASE2 domain-containing sensor protein
MKLSPRLIKLIADVLAACILLTLFLGNTLWYFEHLLQDTVFQREPMPYPNIIVIGIDEEAIGQFGNPAQWNRSLMASALEILNSSEEYKPAVIALDIIYVGESPDPEADARLANAAKSGGNIVTAARVVTGEIRSGLRAVHAIVGYEKPYDDLARYVNYGIVNAIFDNDRRVRRVQPVYKHNDEIMYCFSYEIYKKYLGLEDRSPWADNHDKYIIYHGSPGTYKEFSFADIFKDDFEPEYFADAIVLIGAFAPALQDAYHVPGYSEQMNGVEIHANIIQTFLEENFKEYTPFAVNLAILLFMIILTLVLAHFLEIRVLLAACAGLSVIYAVAALLTFNMGFILPLIYPALALAFIYIYQLAYRYIIERIERKKAQLIAEKHQILVDSINYASVIQRSILPKDSAFAQAFADYSIRWDPRDTVGGDIYWIKNFEKGTLLCVCDCTGHGVPGALLTALVVSSFEEIVNEDTCADPASIIWMLDQKLTRVFETEAQEGKSTRDIYIKNGCDLAVLFIAKDGSVTVSSGNINVFICDGKKVHRIKGQKISVGEGKLKSGESVKATVIPADNKNKFYISSDGMYDQIGGTNNYSFGYNILKSLILEHHSKPQAYICDTIWEAFENYRGTQTRRDDFELITFQTF